MSDRYTVKKLTNLLEPEVGTHQSKAKVEELMADPKVQVIVTER